MTLTAAYILHINDRKAFDLHIDLEVDLEDVYLGKTKKVTYDVNDTFGCRRRRSVRVSLVGHADSHIFKAKADESPWAVAHPEISPGDLVVHLCIKPHSSYHIDTITSYDLNTTLRVSLYDYYYGNKLRLELIDGGHANVSYEPRGNTNFSPGATSSTNCEIMPDMGLPYYDDTTQSVQRGDLNVFFELCLPSMEPKDLNGTLMKFVLARLFLHRYPVTRSQ